MRDVAQPAELAPCVVRVQKVDGDVIDPTIRLAAPPREPDHVPVAHLAQMLDQLPADHPSSAYDDRFLRIRFHRHWSLQPIHRDLPMHWTRVATY